METKNIYAKGLYFNKNHKDTPEEVKKWKKGGIAIQIDSFVAQLTELKSYADEKGYIKFDLVENEKQGEKFLSFKLNTYKRPEPEPREVIKADEIPF